MIIELIPHRDTPCTALSSITAELTWLSPGVLQINYRARGNIGGVRWPSLAKPARVDGLWAKSCFELFAAIPATNSYLEFNFSPSSEWAAYRFDQHREGMRDFEMLTTPQIETRPKSEEFCLQATIDLAPVAKMGLFAVIEETSGAKSYWAITHPHGKPDFHHRDCFAHELKAAGGS